MTAEEVLTSMTRILRDLLGDESIVLAPATRRGDVDGWDSLAYVNFIVALEMHFAVKFRVAEVESFETVGQIADSTLNLLAARDS